MLILVLLLRQALEAVIEEEERTVPGEAPGIYACDYKKLAQIHCRVAEGRVELLQGNLAHAQVRTESLVAVVRRLVATVQSESCSRVKSRGAHTTCCVVRYAIMTVPNPTHQPLSMG